MKKFGNCFFLYFCGCVFVRINDDKEKFGLEDAVGVLTK